MRNPWPPEVEAVRIRDGLYGSNRGERAGAFEFGGLRVIANDACRESRQWEHVSASRDERCPSWEDMHMLKRLFWRDDECAVQFHPPEADYINCHPYTLHMWRDARRGHRLPPAELV